MRRILAIENPVPAKAGDFVLDMNQGVQKVKTVLNPGSETDEEYEYYNGIKQNTMFATKLNYFEI